MSELVVYREPEVLRCCVCHRSPLDTAWSSYRVTYANGSKSLIAAKVALGDGCEECVDAVKQASSPKIIGWQQVSQDCKREDMRQKYLDYKLRFAGKPTNTQRSSVHTATRIGARLPSRQQKFVQCAIRIQALVVMLAAAVMMLRWLQHAAAYWFRNRAYGMGGEGR